jgi:hypothetical protein
LVGFRYGLGVVVVVTLGVVAGLGLVVGGFVWVARLLLGVVDRQMVLTRELLLPQPQPEPLPEVQSAPMLSRMPVVDPTDGLIPDFGGGAGLASAFPNVDPWLIGEQELPETIDEVVMDPDGPEVMLPDGTWVPLMEAGRDDPAPDEP